MATPSGPIIARLKFSIPYVERTFIARLGKAYSLFFFTHGQG